MVGREKCWSIREPEDLPELLLISLSRKGDVGQLQRRQSGSLAAKPILHALTQASALFRSIRRVFALSCPTFPDPHCPQLGLRDHVQVH